jgi:LPS O-antigen subunit length determinant protein (WzzB/FepE family)
MLELKKMQLERMKVDCAKQEMELRIFEKEEEISRLKENIKNQDKRINELNEAIESLKGE